MAELTRAAYSQSNPVKPINERLRIKRKGSLVRRTLVHAVHRPISNLPHLPRLPARQGEDLSRVAVPSAPANTVILGTVI